MCLLYALLCAQWRMSKLRASVLKLAHEDAGHWGVCKTCDQILRHFFWSCLKGDSAAYIEKCHTCQLIGKPNQSVTPAPDPCCQPAFWALDRWLHVSAASFQIWYSLSPHCHVSSHLLSSCVPVAHDNGEVCCPCSKSVHLIVWYPKNHSKRSGLELLLSLVCSSFKAASWKA